MSWGYRTSNPFWLPLDKRGFINHKAVFQVVYVELKQPYGVLDDMGLKEVSWLIQGNEESKKDYYEMVSYAVKNAMVSVNKGKDYKLFEDNNSEESKLTKEERETELAYLKNTFNGL